LVAALLAGLILASSLGTAHAGEWFEWKWRSIDQACGGDCAVTLFAGPSIATDQSKVIGTSGFVAPWNWDLTKDVFVGVSASRRVATLAGVIDLEPETGVGQRFGKSDEAELWVAIYARWTLFPWNRWLYTTLAASTGLSYATGISDRERKRGGGRGSHLLHYFSPEITFALPERRDKELILRFHHRSGMSGKEVFNTCVRIFNCVTGGEQFVTAGVRLRF